MAGVPQESRHKLYSYTL